MLRRACSSRSMMSGLAGALLAAAAVSFDSPAQAECIVQPNQQAPEGAHWSLHTDRFKNRRCWVLVDAAGQDISTPQPQPGQTPAPSVFQTILGNFTGGGPPTPPAQEAPAPVPPVPSGPRLHRQPIHAATASRERAVRTEQRAEPRERSDVRAVKHELTEQEREALFEEFLRWHESQQIIGTMKPAPR